MKKSTTAIGDVGFRFGSSGRMTPPSEKRFAISLSHLLPLPFVMAMLT